MGKTQTHGYKSTCYKKTDESIKTSKKISKKIPWYKWKYKNNFTKSLGCSKRNYKREVYSNIGLPQETRKNIK